VVSIVLTEDMRAMSGVSKNRHGVSYVLKKVPKWLEQATACAPWFRARVLCPVSSFAAARQSLLMTRNSSPITSWVMVQKDLERTGETVAVWARRDSF